MGKTCRWKHLARVPPPVLHPGAAPHPGVLPLSLPPSPPSSHSLYTSPSFSPSLAPYPRLYLPPSLPSSHLHYLSTSLSPSLCPSVFCSCCQYAFKAPRVFVLES